MGIECRRCRLAGRCVPGDWSAAKWHELSQRPRAPLTAGFGGRDALQIPCDVARSWPGTGARQGLSIGQRMNSRGRHVGSVDDHSWRRTHGWPARLRAGQDRLDAHHLASVALWAVAQ